MIPFFADDHYDSHPGRVIFEGLPQKLREKIRFYENDWEALSNGEWLKDCQLLVLHMIGGTCDQPHPDQRAEEHVRRWCEKGGNLLLLHGSSAAFWQWEWWRRAMALRWVRGNDPDGMEESFHPVHPYAVKKTSSTHPLTARLRELDLPKDEIYAHLAEQLPFDCLMDTDIPEGHFPQCVIAATPWGGQAIHFLPGHYPEGAGNSDLLYDVQILMEYLL